MTKKTPTTTRERKISRKKWISFHMRLHLYADCRSNKTKQNKRRKKCIPLAVRVHVSLVSFFVWFVLHFLIGLLFIRLSFANFAMWNILTIWEKTNSWATENQIVHFYALACLVDSHTSTVVFAHRWIVYTFYLFIYLFSLFFCEKLNDWNVTTSTITTRTKRT